jgi:serine/threonine-protein kinase
MGEVYITHDTKLGRDVALKVLPESFASSADRLARFKREAQVLASLNHPNIATIHGLEEANGNCALVMELVEGATLVEKFGVAGAERSSAVLKHDNWPNAELALCASRRTAKSRYRAGSGIPC